MVPIITTTIIPELTYPEFRFEPKINGDAKFEIIFDWKTDAVGDSM